MTEAKVWKVFSQFIRMRDADENGNCKCFTCGLIRHWTKGDCGHGVPRQHKATKYNEQNNHFQCKRCNGFEGGMREAYKENMDRKYGSGTWDKMMLASRQVCKRTKNDFEILYLYYSEQVKRLKESKRL